MGLSIIKFITAGIIGIIFGFGIILSGMINPKKVINFFDITGSWDPSLLFVMIGGLSVTMLGYYVVFKRTKPILEPLFQPPRDQSINAKLIIGASLFGIGWGIAGFCPGAVLPAIGFLQLEIILFLTALIFGIITTKISLKFIP